jgi:uncharacterized protein (TIRG00374 family)
MAKSSSQSLLKRVSLGIFLGVIVLIVLAFIGDIRQVSQVILNFQWRYFFYALGFTLVNYCLRFLKWHFYLGQIGIRNISVLESARLFVAGFPLAVTPGKVGEALKGVWLQQRSGLPIGKGISVVVAERISDGLAVLALSTFGVVAYPQYWPAFVIILIILLALILISQIRPLALWVLDFSDHLPVIRKFSVSIREFYEGSYALFRPKATFLAVSLGTISWFGEGIGFYLILVGLGLNPTPTLAAEAVFILAFSTVVGAASALPGGLGAAEASIAGMIALIMNPPAAITASATFLIRLATLWFGITLGLLTWLFSGDLLGLNKDQLQSFSSNPKNGSLR